MSGTKQKVKDIIIEHLGVLPEEVADGADLRDDLGADSLDMVELVMAAEEVLGIPEIDDEECYKIKTVSDLVACVERYVNK